MALQSQLFRGDSKLEAAAVSDPAHILPGANGPHVGKIQLALIQLDGAAISQDSVYGPSTAAAVRAFKQKRQILNFQGRIDDIVGKKTMSVLDGEMLAKERGGGSGGRLGFKVVDDNTPFGPPTLPKPLPIADIVVRFAGAAVPGDMPTDDVLSPTLVPAYQRMPVPNSVSRIGLFGRVLQRRDNGRLLLRVGRSTATIGPASIPVFIDVLADLARLQIGLKALPGKIFIFGSSSGGRNAIDFAAHITRLGSKPHFVAAIDAPFFQSDTPNRPNAKDDRDVPKTVPVFTVDAGSTPNRFNFFQTIGNHVKSSLNPLNQNLFFTSRMRNEEIHGEVAGFQNINLNRSVTQPKSLNDNTAHEQCGDAGDGEARRLIAADILRGA